MDDSNVELLPSLYGSRIARNKAVGRCNYHKTAMTVKMMKQHGCLCKHGKHCDAFQKYEEHDYWRQRALKKANKKQTA